MEKIENIKIKCDLLKGKTAVLLEDFTPESLFWETGHWFLKKGTKVYITGNESDGRCYIEHMECGFEIYVSFLELC